VKYENKGSAAYINLNIKIEMILDKEKCNLRLFND